MDVVELVKTSFDCVVVEGRYHEVIDFCLFDFKVEAYLAVLGDNIVLDLWHHFQVVGVGGVPFKEVLLLWLFGNLVSAVHLKVVACGRVTCFVRLLKTNGSGGMRR